MNAIVPKRPLNDAFKRFQRLPALPAILGDEVLARGSVEEVAQLPKHPAEERPPAQEWIEQALAG
ncbi:MAG TPA: hypothetical protein VHI52_21255 [Verrucomicrobiae bacterium]|nr:hypothetical protein [Verrucomicrobiae bacterium]